jgi:predicted Zn-dependent peptidase
VARRAWLVTSALACALVVASASPGVGAATPAEHTTLGNGISVVSRQRHGSQVVAIDLAVRAGARHEDEVSGSAAHFLEHALLLGTERRPTRDQLLRSITSRGGRLGVTAGREIVELTVNVGLPELDLGLDVLHDVLTASRFDEQALEAERRVILQELAQRADDPETVASDALFDTLFTGHPLQHPPSGTREGVQRLTVDRLRSFWQRRLVGDNIIVGVVSGLDHAAVVERLEAALGAIPAGPPSERKLVPLPLDGAASLTLPAGTDQAHVFVGARLPGVATPDRAALRVASTVLGRSGGRLFTEIRDRRGLAYSTYAAVPQYTDGGIFLMYAGTEGANASEVADLLLAELARLREEPVAPPELADAIGSDVGAQVIADETSRAEAITLTRSIVFGLPPRDEEERRLRAVTAEDVRRVANAYLSPGRLTVLIARPAADGEP